MATQRCPKCGSNRIRPGYRKTSFLKKLFFRYNLLCNSCNLEFVGFAIPGTLNNKSKHKKKYPDPNFRKPDQSKNANEDFVNEILEPIEISSQFTENSLPNPNRQRVRVKKRVKVRF